MVICYAEPIQRDIGKAFVIVKLPCLPWSFKESFTERTQLRATAEVRRGCYIDG